MSSHFRIIPTQTHPGTVSAWDDAGPCVVSAVSDRDDLSGNVIPAHTILIPCLPGTRRASVARLFPIGMVWDRRCSRR